MRVRHIILILLTVCFFTGCVGQNPEPTGSAPAQQQDVESAPPESSEAAMPHAEERIRFANEKGEKLAGRFFPAEGDTAVLLAHMGIADQESWHDFAVMSAERDIAALTFDFHCFGASECTSSSGNPANLRDIRAAYDILRQKGYARIVCMGASLGGTACLNLSMEERLAGLVVIASERPWGMKEYPENLVDKTIPKLFIVTDRDPYESVISEIHTMYDASPEPKQLKIFPGTVHGTDIFETEHGEEFRDLLLGFLEMVAGNPLEGRGGAHPHYVRDCAFDPSWDVQEATSSREACEGSSRCVTSQKSAGRIENHGLVGYYKNGCHNEETK